MQGYLDNMRFRRHIYRFSVMEERKPYGVRRIEFAINFAIYTQNILIFTSYLDGIEIFPS